MTRTGLLWASWATGLAVAVAGPIGFVGILVPHAVRLFGGLMVLAGMVVMIYNVRKTIEARQPTIDVRFMKSRTERPEEKRALREVGKTWFGPAT